MYLQELDRLEPDAVLGKTVLDETGRPLLVAGTALTPRYVDALRRRGLAAVYVRDGLADDLAPSDAISERLRADVTRNVAEVFERVSVLAADRAPGDGSVDGAVAALGEQPLQLDDDGATVATLYRDVEALLTEILHGEAAAGLDSLKSHNEYTFQHSVDVAVLGALVGRRLAMPHDRLRELALGCLLHDIGKTYIDRAILDKPGPLDASEFEIVQEHPRMGYELVRRMPCASLLPAHVAYQHHEQQGGRGYPRGLVGSNSVAGRTHHERIGAGQMLLIAEIGAVADVYSALSSDRPYRAALPPDEVGALLGQMAGTHLNREIVETLRRIVPSYPVGHWVEVTTGARRGWRGVVSEVRAVDVDRPVVRLLLDADGEPLSHPDELDLRAQPDAALACLPGHQAPQQMPAAARV
jgi:HD-GYP domain-containing protein (c-di-GMP phosphodiesterase class II)